MSTYREIAAHLAFDILSESLDDYELRVSQLDVRGGKLVLIAQVPGDY